MTRVDGRSMVPYLPRLVDAQLDRILGTFPAALVLGPRASGKTTTARRIASDVVELDDAPQAAPFRADAGAALALLTFLWVDFMIVRGGVGRGRRA